jgi:hypothetical protein
MAGKRRLRRKACEGKRKHATREGALVELRRVAADRRDSIGAYRCKHCGHFHIGHRRGTRFVIRPTLAPLLRRSTI